MSSSYPCFVLRQYPVGHHTMFLDVPVTHDRAESYIRQSGEDCVKIFLFAG